MFSSICFPKAPTYVIKKIALFTFVLLSIATLIALIFSPKLFDYIELRIAAELQKSDASFQYASIRPGFSGEWTVMIRKPVFKWSQQERDLEFKSDQIQIRVPFRLLFGKRVVISEIRAENSQITIRRKNELIIDAQRTMQALTDSSERESGNASHTVEKSLPISIQQITIHNGELRFEISSNSELKIDQIDGVIKDPLVERQMHAKGKLRVAGNEQNSTFDMRVNRNEKNELILQESSLDINLSDMDEVKMYAMLTKQQVFPLKHLLGEASWKITEMALDDQDWENAAQQLNITKANFYFENHPESLQDVTIRARQANQKFDVSLQDATWSDGKLAFEFQASPSETMGKSGYDAQIQLQVDGIVVEKAIVPKEDRSPFMSGLFYAGFKGGGQVETFDQFPYKISGDGRVVLDQGAIQNLNILRTIFEKLSSVPSVGSAVMSRIPIRFQDAMNRGYTSFARVEFPVRYQDGRLFLNQIPFISEGFSASVSGWLDLSGHIVLRAYISLDDELTWNMMQAAPALQYIVSGDGKLGLAVDIYRSSQGIQLKFDLQPLISRAVQQVGSELLSKALKGF